MNTLSAYCRLLRPKHWIKNILIFAPLVFSQTSNLQRLNTTFLAFVAFSLLASSVYILNDIADAPADRQHPEKKSRPIAAGLIKPNPAILLATFLILLSTAIGWLISWPATCILLFYFALNLSYSLGLKKRVILDVMIIAFGFVLRILVGGLAAAVSISPWIILCTFFATLFMGFGKRKNEIWVMQEDSHRHRAVLLHYTPDFLNQLLGITAAMTVMSYSLYTIDDKTIRHFGTDKLIYTIPFVLYGIFRFFHILYNKPTGGDPIKILERDFPLLITILLWLLSFIFIIQLAQYAG